MNSETHVYEFGNIRVKVPSFLRGESSQDSSSLLRESGIDVVKIIRSRGLLPFGDAPLGDLLHLIDTSFSDVELLFFTSITKDSFDVKSMKCSTRRRNNIDCICNSCKILLELFSTVSVWVMVRLCCCLLCLLINNSNNEESLTYHVSTKP